MLAAVVLAVRGHRRRALVWVVGVVVGATLIRLVKVVVERPRPPVGTRLAVETTASLPSGHSLMAALGLGLTVAAVVTLTHGARGAAAVRTAVALLGLAAALVIGASRAYLGVHWATDVVAGWLLGAALATACITVAGVIGGRPAGRALDTDPGRVDDDRDGIRTTRETG